MILCTQLLYRSFNSGNCGASAQCSKVPLDKEVGQVAKNIVVPSTEIVIDICTKKSIHISDADDGPGFLKIASARVRALRNIFEDASDCIIFLEMSGKILDVNKKAIEVFGRSRKELLGRHLRNGTVPTGDTSRQLINFAEVLASRKEVLCIRTKGREGKEFILECSPSIIKIGNKPIAIVIIARDITERKKMEDELRRYANDLESLVEERTKKLKEAERLAAIGELAMMVGHDLRNPLASMEYASYYLRTNYVSNLDNDGLRMLKLIEEDIGRSNKIVNDLLDYAVKIKLDLEITDVKSILKETYRFLKVPENIKVVDLTKYEPKIRVDFLKIQRVFINMLKNAIDAMPDGGTLTIESKEAKGNVEVTISDTGTGMSEETLEKLWTPLFTTKAKGMGFGLAISKRLIEAHEGNVSARSELEKGTTFTITIPIEPQQRDLANP